MELRLTLVREITEEVVIDTYDYLTEKELRSQEDEVFGIAELIEKIKDNPKRFIEINIREDEVSISDEIKSTKVEKVSK